MKLTIDNQVIKVERGATILEAARQAGIEIPTLCQRDGSAPSVSCFLCAVKVDGRENLLPACATPVEDGMVVEAHSEEVAAARKTALELLLSDHAGGCVAPCSMSCPADIDIPAFIRELRAGRAREAVAIIKARIPFASVLGEACPAYCEPACVRKNVDEEVSIRALHRCASELDRATGAPWRPECAPDTGKRVAIVGAGPAGLSAAYYLRQAGHACIVLEAAGRAGGLLRAIPRERLNQETVDAEIALIEELGIEFRFNWRLGQDGSLDDLRRDNDAVLLAFGATIDRVSDQRKVDLEFVKSLGVEVKGNGLLADRRTLATSLAGVFAAGEVVRGANKSVRAVAMGRQAAVSIDQFLSGAEVTGEPKRFYFWRRGDAKPEETQVFHDRAEAIEKVKDRPEVFSAEEGGQESRRCLQCSCVKEHTCHLRRHSAAHGANPYRFRGARRTLAPDASHAEIVYDPGQCILCGICLKIAEEAGEERGLSFAGRGLDTRVTVPLNGSLSDGLRRAARACAEACPTAAFSLKDER